MQDEAVSIIEQWEEEIINEGKRNNQKDEKMLSSKITNLYCHMIKYKYCKEWQDTQWDGTIKRECDTIRNYMDKFNTTVLNNINTEKLFDNGIKEAEKESGKYNQSIDKDRIPDHPIDKTKHGSLDWLNLDNISNKDKILDWLSDNERRN